VKRLRLGMKAGEGIARWCWLLLVRLVHLCAVRRRSTTALAMTHQRGFADAVF
jgi:hypothetical protein